MSTQVVEKKIASKSKQKRLQTQTPTEALCAEYVEKRQKLDAGKKKLKGLEDAVNGLESLLRAYADQVVGEAESTQLASGEYVIEIGIKGRQVVGFDSKKIQASLPTEIYEAVVRFSVEDLTKYLPGKILAAVVKYQRLRKRSIDIKKANLAP